MRILVTGGEGFIGKYVQSRGRELGYHITTYDIIKGQDVLNHDQFLDAVDRFAPDAIIHLAGMLGTHELWDTTDKAIDVNIKGALNVARVALEADAKLVSIEQPHIWYNVYEATKLAARRMLTGMHYDQGLRVEFVTAHNAFGPGQAHGEGHPQKIIPTFATKAWAGEPIPVWGDGKQKVNLVYAGDVADMLLRRAAATRAAYPHTNYNAGTDTLLTVNDVVQLVQSIAGNSFHAEYVGNRRGEQNELEYPEPDYTYPYRLDMTKLVATVNSYKPSDLNDLQR